LKFIDFLTLHKNLSLFPKFALFFKSTKKNSLNFFVTKPKFLQFDPHYSERNSDYSTHVYGVAAGGAGAASGTQYETGVGWVGVTTYMDNGGNLRVKKEILCAMSGITTGNTAGGKTYPNISLAN